MNVILELARVLLASVFLLASLTKLADLAGSRRSLADFGVPAAVVGPVGILLPVLELIVAIALIPAASATYGALGALLLLTLFVAGIGINLARGRRPDCHCFGQLYSKPVGRMTIARNIALLLVAAVVVLGGGTQSGPSLLAWAGPLTALQHAAVYSGGIVLGLLGLQSVLLFRLLQQNSQLVERLSMAAPGVATGLVAQPSSPIHVPAPGRPVGTPAPEFTLPAIDGRTWSLVTLRAEGKPVILFFSDPNCGPCATLLPEFAELEQRYAHALTIVLITRGTAEANREKIQGLTRVLLQRDRETLEAYGVAGTPTVVLVNPDGTIGSALAAGDTAIRQLLAPIVQAIAQPLPPEAVPAPAPPPALPPLAAAPDFNLIDLDGHPLTLDRFASRSRLVLFWNPGCGYCQNMLPGLKTWESIPESDRAQLVVVSTGSVEDNRALGLRSPIGLDPEGFAIAQRYGVQGTPSAALVDPQGRIAAEIAVGAPAIFALVGGVMATEVEAPAEPAIELSSDARPLKERCVHDELLADGSMVLYNGCRHQVMTLNPTAALVWEYCDGEHDLDSIVAELRDVFPKAHEAGQDVRVVLGNLLKSGMILPSQPAGETAPIATGSPAETRS